MKQNPVPHVAAFLLAFVHTFSFARAEPPVSRDELIALRDAFAGVQSVYFEASRRAGDSPHPESDVQTMIAVSHADGRFAAYHFHPPAGSRPVPSQIVHYDGRVIRELYGLGTYQEYEPGGDYFRFPSPIHQFFVPWAHMTAWIDLLLAQNDLVLDTHNAVHVARSESIGLALEWKPPNTLCAVHLLPSPTRAGVRIELSDFGNSPVSAFPVPKTFVQITDTTMAAGTGKGVRARAVFDVTRVEINPPDIETRLAFDPAKLGLSDRRDPSTKNYYSLDGKFLFNEDDFLAEFDAALGRKSRWHPMTIVAITIGTLLAIVVVVKRYRASHA